MYTTKLISLFFYQRQQQIDLFSQNAELIQRQQLDYLLKQAKNTEWGIKYDYTSISDYKNFAQRVPIQTYEDVKPYINRLIKGETNLLWPTEIKWFAKSSGTTNDKSKFIPVSDESMEDCHYQGGKDCVAIYLKINPESQFFSGKGLILGGSHKISDYSHNIRTGDLSAVLIQNINPLVNLIRVPDKEIALMDEWESKLEKIVDDTVNRNITNISGVPSWFLVLIKKILSKTGKSNLLEVWPNLEVFFHGGISFAPYREQYQKLIPSDKMYYIETYNASEGFFAIQNDLSDPGMLLMIDLGIFYEFIPFENINDANPVTLPLWEVELNKNYAMLISTNSGLWRYQIGDTVRFTSVNPYKIIISGRTKHYINAFGEELMVDNTDKGLAVACSQTGATVLDYTAAPVFMSDHLRGRHQWVIEFDKLPESLDAFADILDSQLQQLNSDYEAKRYKDIALSRLEIIPAKKGLFHDWLKDKGKLGGQHKIPRLSNNREYIEQLLEMNKKQY